MQIIVTLFKNFGKTLHFMLINTIQQDMGFGISSLTSFGNICEIQILMRFMTLYNVLIISIKRKSTIYK